MSANYLNDFSIITTSQAINDLIADTSNVESKDNEIPVAIGKFLNNSSLEFYEYYGLVENRIIHNAFGEEKIDQNFANRVIFVDSDINRLVKKWNRFVESKMFPVGFQIDESALYEPVCNTVKTDAKGNFYEVRLQIVEFGGSPSEWKG